MTTSTTTSALLSYTVVTNSASVTLVSNTVYLCTDTTTAIFTLPTTMPPGSVIGLVRTNTGNWQIAQLGGQQIFVGSSSTTSGATGTLTSTAAGDSVMLVTTNGSAFYAVSVIGNLTLA